MLDGDLAAQRRFNLQAILADALYLLCQPSTGFWALDVGTEAHLLTVVRDTAAELRTLPGEDAVPF